MTDRDVRALTEEPTADLALLRAYEPVLAYTAGELFFPADVEEYVRCCGLWRDSSDEAAEEVVPVGELTTERLAAVARESPGASLWLLFVQRPMHGAEVRRHRRAHRPTIAKIGRLAAVGLIGRVFDVALRASLFIRGVVPGGVAAAAAELYQRKLGSGDCTYYGRVLRDGGYVILQYWYFYAMNDWRTTFGGVNDHEADWESVTVYLAETEAGPRPTWVGVSAHDDHGDDLRRRWDDPDLLRDGEHPVVFVGAGSHSGAVVPGDYVVTVNPVRLRTYVRGVKRLTSLLVPWTREGRRYGVGIPFVDYARGNGVKVGVGGDRSWHAVVVTDDTPWVRDFHGLWGRDTRDWFGGERAPAGPRYDRDGLVRDDWADPLGWAGLQKIPPDPAADRRRLTARITELDERIADADAKIADARDRLRTLRTTAVSMDHHVNTRTPARRRFAEVAEAEAALTELCRDRIELAEERTAHRAGLRHGLPAEPPQAHLREPTLPFASRQRRRTRFLHTWAAVSTPLFLLAVAAVFLIPNEPHHLLSVVAVILVFLVLEAWARRKLLIFAVGLLQLVAGAAIVAGIVLAVVYGGLYVVFGPVVVIALLLLFVNLRELLRK